MDIEIIAVGAEVLSGHTINANAAFLAKNLSKLGYKVIRHTALSDDVEMIRKGIEEASKRVSLVFITGGLGPTIDDKTKEATDFFYKSSSPLKNSIGTALGQFYQGRVSLILLPGVPREMEKMFLEEVVPLLQTHFPLDQNRHSVGSYLCLLKEIEVNPFLLELQRLHPQVEIGIYPSQGLLFIEFSGEDKRELLQMTDLLAKTFLSFFVGEDPVALSLHRELISRKKQLALAESCTGGAMAAALTAIPDASLYFLGSLVVYSNRWKETFLEVSRTTLTKSGAVSKQAIEEMIQGLFRETDADFAIAISGIFGPSGGNKEKPVGTTYIGIGERGQKTDIGKLNAPLDRKSAIEWGVQTAFGALWRRLVHGVVSFS